MNRSWLVALVCWIGLLLGPGVIEGQTLKLSVETVTAVAGQPVAIRLRLVGAAAVGALQLDVVYDPAVLEIKSVERAALLQGMDYSSLESNASDTPGRLKLALLNQFPLGDAGVLAEIRGTARGRPGQRTRLTIENAEATRSDTSRQKIPVEVVNGELTLDAAPASPVTPPVTVPPVTPPVTVPPVTPPVSVPPVTPPVPATTAVAPSGGGGGGAVLPQATGPGALLVGGVVGLVGAMALAVGVLALRKRRAADPVHGGITVAARLDIHEPDGSVRSVRITAMRTTIGRLEGNAVLIDDPQVSGHHAEIVAGPGGFVLRDLHSTGGTSVNGRSIEETPIYLGDEITVGSTRVVLGE